MEKYKENRIVLDSCCGQLNKKNTRPVKSDGYSYDKVIHDND